ncbi:hypothetical protein [Halolamina salina]|uniref:AAA ATPase domain-containing protein n=1 Tax=Halolamina salina TaxID=1220023 RepID=A0ABD6BAQ6_9EURY
METRKASLDREWEALTSNHERELARAIDSFEQFQSGHTVDPLALVGAYRSGKTQLIYHLFNEAWNRGIPAFYVGDPGAMLSEFEASDESDLNEWIDSRIQAQLEAFENGAAPEIDWFPNVDSASKRDFVEAHADTVASGDTSRTALFFDEVEQSYRAFIQATDKDDDNPLRKINDGLQDTIKVWSFGMISAFEFIGEADWGRMKEIRIPPLSVADVRTLLAERRPDATDLANIIWWLSRGRTGIIIKLIEELPDNPEEEAGEWVRDLADANFKDTRLINNLWTELPHESWDDAITSLLFQPEGLESWRVQGEKALNSETCLTIAINIIKDEYEFEDTDTGRDALSILERNVERVVQGLAVGEDQQFPQFGLQDNAQADAFLDLISNMTVSFEPAGEERRMAIDALDELKGRFDTHWVQRASDADVVETSVATAAPVQIRDAFPPIAVNPERVSATPSDDLRPEMERGLTLQTAPTTNKTVSIQFCPTETTFRSELTELTNGFDITDPAILVVPADEEFDASLSEAAEVYQRHSLLQVREYQSNRFWSFVLNLFGRLRSEGFDDPYTVNNSIKSDLLGRISEREVRNTIETLYDQLEQVATEEADSFASDYQNTYSLSTKTTLLWEEERLQDDTPYWSNGRFVESTIAISYLPVFGPEYESGRNYSRLHNQLSNAISNDLVSGGANGFKFKEYFSDMFTQSGYSGNVTTERAHYREGGQIAPAVQQTQSALTALAELNDTSSIVSKIDNPDVDVADGNVPVVGVAGLSDLAYGLFRALLIRGLTTGSDPAIDVPQRLENITDNLRDQKETVEGYIEQVESLDERVTPPESVSVGTWIEITAARLEQYKTNLKEVINGVTDLIDKCQVDSTAAPIGYHYWFLLQIYLDDISDQIEDLQSEISRASVSDIDEAVQLFDQVYSRAEHSGTVSMHFSSRESLLKRLEDYGNDVFDLESHLGATSLSIPEDREDLSELNGSVETHKQYLTQLNNDLKMIEDESDVVAEELEQTKRALVDLLEPEEVTIND